MKLVGIKWVDSIQPIPHWQQLSEYKPLDTTEIYSVGFMVHGEDGKSEMIGLAPNVSDIGTDISHVSGVIHIPRICVLEVVDLEPKKPVKEKEELGSEE